MNPKITLKKGNCIDILKEIPKKSINLIYADPPYNLSGKNYVSVKNGKLTKGFKGEWDVIEDYKQFTSNWVSECLRILKDDGTIWISGSLHNHPTVGVTLKELGLWIMNDIIWYKPNAPPLLRTTRLAPATELIWLAAKSKKYYFDYELAKKINKGKQMRNLWDMAATRHVTKHPTEKPERLLERIILIGSREGDNVLDPFMGSGTTGVVAKKLNRNFTGIEIDENYFEMAKKRIEKN